MIVDKAVETSYNEDVILVGDDTDLLVLLLDKCASTNTNNQRVIFKPQPKMTHKTKPKCWDIKYACENLPAEVVKHVLFLNALYGCDTTSRLPGLRNDHILRLATDNKAFQQHALLFTCSTTPQDNVIASGLSILSSIYKSTVSLDATRVNMFTQKTKTHNELCEIDRYPPTEAAAIFHVKRLFLQVCSWKGINLDPLKWGFFLKDGKMLPSMTSLDVAPASVLDKIKCSCRTTCTKRCSCRNLGIDCTNNCTKCIYSCLNKPDVGDDPYLEEILPCVL